MNKNLLPKLTKELLGFKDPKRALFVAGYFKTGKGQYGEGDIFLGISVPQQRKIAKKYQELDLPDLQTLLANKVHDFRLVALFILVIKYKKARLEKEKKEIVDLYLKNTKQINNWDLVDSSAGYILGDYLYHKCHPESFGHPEQSEGSQDKLREGSNRDSSAEPALSQPNVPQNDKDKKILYKLARSNNIWQRRISIIATQGFIRNNKFEDTLKISEILLNDKHDLIHKAVGWMLREVGNRDLKTEENFLDRHYQKMPRTMLRYAIEKLEKRKREFYMKRT